MSHITRRSVIKVAAATSLLTTGFPFIARAQTPEITLKFGNNQPMTHPMNIHAVKIQEAVKERTKGRVQIDLFPNNQLGGDTDMLSQLRRGSMHIFMCSGLVQATVVPLASLNTVGFAFKDYDQVWKAMDGSLGAFIRKATEKVGIHLMENCWDNGFRQITNNRRPILTPKDMEGLKIRVPVSPMIVDMFKGLGSAPVGMQYSEVYSSLQTKVIDAQENPLSIISIGKMYEVQKYLSFTNHMWDGFWVLFNAKTWNKLPSDIKTILEEEFAKGAMGQREDVRKLNEEVAEEMKQQGMEINTLDTTPFREKLKESGYYSTWQKKFGDEAWAVLEDNVGKLS